MVSELAQLLDVFVLLGATGMLLMGFLTVVEDKYIRLIAKPMFYLFGLATATAAVMRLLLPT